MPLRSRTVIGWKDLTLIDQCFWQASAKIYRSKSMHKQKWVHAQRNAFFCINHRTYICEHCFMEDWFLALIWFDNILYKTLCVCVGDTRNVSVKEAGAFTHELYRAVDWGLHGVSTEIRHASVVLNFTGSVIEPDRETLWDVVFYYISADRTMIRQSVDHLISTLRHEA